MTITIKAFILGLLSIIFLGILPPTHAQSSRRAKGYIIQSQDTIRGWIRHQSHFWNNRRVKFSKDNDKNFAVFIPSQLNGYGYEQAFFLSKTIQLDGQEQTFFLRRLVAGTVNLFEVINTNQQGLLLTERNGKWHPISKKTFAVDIKKFEGYTKITNESPRARSQDQIRDFVLKYNRSKGDKVDENTILKPTQIRPTFGLKIGVDFNNVTGVDSGNQYYKVKFNDPTTFSVGGFMNIPLGKWTSIQPEIWYTDARFDSDNVPTPFFPKAFEKVSMRVQALRFPLMGKVILPTPKMRLLGLAGASIGVILSDEATRKTEGFTYESNTFDFKTPDLGFITGLGIEIDGLQQNTLGLEVRYNYNFISIEESVNGVNRFRNSYLQLVVNLGFK